MKVKETLISSIYNHSLLYIKFERRDTLLSIILFTISFSANIIQ